MAAAHGIQRVREKLFLFLDGTWVRAFGGSIWQQQLASKEKQRDREKKITYSIHDLN
jgi:hypothetical protein